MDAMEHKNKKEDKARNVKDKGTEDMKLCS
jgi:hypothetical protein